MDANGHRFWMLAGPGDFDLSDGTCRMSGDCVQLAGGLALADPARDRGAALAAADLPAVATGPYDDWAWFDPALGAIAGATGGGESAPLLEVPEGAEVRDLAVDADGVLRIAGRLGDGTEGLAFADLRGRWRVPVVIALEDAAPDRVAGRWLLERSSGRLWQEAGAGLPDLATRTRARHVFQPDPDYTDPLRIEEQPALDILATERIVDCAARPDGLLAVLVLSASATRRTRLHFVSPKGKRSALDVPFPGFASSIGWVSDRRIALSYPGTKRAVVLDIGGADPTALSPVPERYPLAAAKNVRLTRTIALPAWATAYEDGRPRAAPKRLLPLSMPGYRATGTAPAASVIRADEAGTVWHRLVVEGDFPPGTGAIVTLRAAETEAGLATAPAHAHALGIVPAPGGTPRLAWIGARSEIALHPGLLDRDPVKDRTGIFTGLVQTTDTISRELAGRCVRLEAQLFGSGQATPSIAAIRLYGGRFSLVKSYLPEVLRPPADPALRKAEGPAHPLDFYDRFTAGFEAVLTRIEDEVARAPALTDPMAAPSGALDWLAGWIGLSLQPGMGEQARRVMLANGMRLHRRRGTMAGLRLALDIASEGQVGAGGIVALEDFRLRRVFATILGADLGRHDDPLFAGPVESGNSFVGPTLTLGEAAGTDPATGAPRLSKAQETELSALYEAPADAADRAAIGQFFGDLAFRVTVLVHAEMDDTRLGLIRDVARQMAPAHVVLRVERASRSLILGLYSLLGIDTALKPRPGAEPTILDRSVLGEKDLILSLPSLDPAADYGETP